MNSQPGWPTRFSARWRVAWAWFAATRGVVIGAPSWLPGTRRSCARYFILASLVCIGGSSADARAEADPPPALGSRTGATRSEKLPTQAPEPGIHRIPPGTFVSPDLTSSQTVSIWLMEVATCVYVFVFGATVGSFLNVVVYRMPRGIGLTRPGSRCPFCQTPILLRDNLPIVGWLKLRGRCRVCRLPISPRYPLVEAAMGLLLLFLAGAELLSGGRNLPVRPINAHGGAIWIIWSIQWDLIRLFVHHSFLLTVLGVLSLIDYDRQRRPRMLLMLLFGIGLIVPIVWPNVHPVPFQIPVPARLQESTWVLGLADVFAGLTVGAACGLASLLGKRDLGGSPGVFLGLAACGAYLGWQAVLSVFLLTACWRLFIACLARLFEPWSSMPRMGCVFLACLMQIPAWRLLATLPWWPGPGTAERGGVISLCVGAALCALASLISSRDGTPDRPRTGQPTQAATSGEPAAHVI